MHFDRIKVRAWSFPSCPWPAWKICSPREHSTMWISPEQWASKELLRKAVMELSQHFWKHFEYSRESRQRIRVKFHVAAEIECKQMIVIIFPHLLWVHFSYSIIQAEWNPLVVRLDGHWRERSSNWRYCVVSKHALWAFEESVCISEYQKAITENIFLIRPSSCIPLRPLCHSETISSIKGKPIQIDAFPMDIPRQFKF